MARPRAATLSVPAELRTARLVLRPWRAEDAEQLEPLLHANHGHLAPWIPAAIATPAPRSQLAERLTGFADDFAANRAWRYAALSAADGELLGELDLFARDASGRVPLADADRAEIGYWLRADRTGRGYATEGARTMIDVARDVPAFTLVEIRCDARNARSGAVPARLGFRRAEGGHSSGRSGAAERLDVWTLSLTPR